MQFERTPLHLAAEYGHKATCRVLVEIGSDTDVVDNVRCALVQPEHSLRVVNTRVPAHGWVGLLT